MDKHFFSVSWQHSGVPVHD